MMVNTSVPDGPPPFTGADEVIPSSLGQGANKVVILMATYNGERHLRDQIDSIIAQTHPNWLLYVSDDGSSDDTRRVLDEYLGRLGSKRVQVVQGPGLGYSANFMSMLRQAVTDADYVAFSDQDDVWDADKLERALSWMARIPTQKPALYAGRSRLIDEAGRPYGYSPLFARRPSFGNALVQSLAGGNTMLINRRARDLMTKPPKDAAVVSHDWWAYLAVTAAGGAVQYDLEPAVGYRQHAANVIGSNAGVEARLKRMWDMAMGRHQAWNDANLSLLQYLRQDMTQDALRRLDHFRRGRQSWLPARAWHFARAGLYRQTNIGNAGLVLTTLLGRL